MTHPVLSDYPFIYQQTVAWGDMDAFGHVNNVQYYRYCESARIGYVQQFQLFEKGYLMVIASSQCRYLRPVFFPDTLSIGVRIEEMRNSSFSMRYTLYSEQQKHIVAEGEAVIVCLDAQTQQKKILSPEIRQQFIDYEATTGHQINML